MDQAAIGRIGALAAAVAFLIGTSTGCRAGSHCGVESGVRCVDVVEYNEIYLQSRLDGHNDAAHAKDPVWQPAVAYEDPTSVLEHVLAHLPSQRPRVYPTEGYYYYRFPLGSRRISGNIRFSDIEDGEISVGYFDESDPYDFRVGRFTSSDPGVTVEYDASNATVYVACGSRSATFLLDQAAFTEPSYPLLEDEVLISGLRDESGYAFHLIYWPVNRSMYYVLNTDLPVPERMHKVFTPEGLEVYFGEVSRFCFFRHLPTGRLILVGVLEESIRCNNWYDGPFDQVPPRLEIGSLLREAYPYVDDAGGIDEHGRFLEREGTRVAISPYRDYRDGESLLRWIDENALPLEVSPRAWTALTYESKRDWRYPQGTPVGGGQHEMSVSVSWPPNHLGNISRVWDVDHKADVSRTSRPNQNAPTARFPR